MIFTPKIRHALRISAIQHDKQYRKDGRTPFIIHPFEVALIVSEYTDDEDVISAALLHDVLEDTQGYSYEKLVEEFGNKVADIVHSLTDEPLPELSWDEKHKKYLEVLEKSSDEAVLVCLADKYANVSSKPVDQGRVWYYQGIIRIAEKRTSIEYSKLLSEFIKLVEIY